MSGNFTCFSNRLTSLEGAPKKVGGEFDCFNNKLTSLKGAPQEIGWDFNCSDNDISSLEGAPPSIGGDIDSGGNAISEEIMEFVLSKIGKEGASLGQAVSKCWESMSEEDRIYLAKDNPDLSPEERRGYEALSRYKTRVI
jgi:hypothetical protein